MGRGADREALSAELYAFATVDRDLAVGCARAGLLKSRPRGQKMSVSALIYKRRQAVIMYFSRRFPAAKLLLVPPSLTSRVSRKSLGSSVYQGRCPE
jgi:hypothetical protein